MQTIQVSFAPDSNWEYLENMARIWGVEFKRLAGVRVEISFNDPIDLFWFACNLENPFDNK